MENEKRLIDANALKSEMYLISHLSGSENICIECIVDAICDADTVDAVEVPCRCCDCYYLLNGKNSFGLYFFCGHQNGLKNLKNTEKDFCMYGKRRYENEIESDA